MRKFIRCFDRSRKERQPRHVGAKKCKGRYDFIVVLRALRIPLRSLREPPVELNKHCLILILFLIPEICFSQDSLSVLSWNIQMLPIIKREGRKARATAIVNQLNKRNYDVIIFQEIFHAHSRNVITEGLKAKYPYNTPILNKKFVTIKTNGGVMIFSKYPIKEIHEIKYSGRTGIDRMSRKGALLAEIDVNGRLVQVAGTHLQAFGEQPIMYAQYEQLASGLLDPHKKEGVPQLICGDFNTIKVIPPKLPDDISQSFIARLARYDYLLTTLKALDGDLEGDQQFTMDRPYNDLCVSRKEYRLLLDYAFLRPNGMTDYSIKRRVQIIRQRWSPEHEDLSDHFGLEAVLKFKD